MGVMFDDIFSLILKNDSSSSAVDLTFKKITSFYTSMHNQK